MQYADEIDSLLSDNSHLPIEAWMPFAAGKINDKSCMIYIYFKINEIVTYLLHTNMTVINLIIFFWSTQVDFQIKIYKILYTTNPLFSLIIYTQY